MSQGDIDTTLRDLRQQRQDVIDELKDVLERCEADDGLSKDEIGQGSLRLVPLVEAYMVKSRVC